MAGGDGRHGMAVDVDAVAMARMGVNGALHGGVVGLPAALDALQQLGAGNWRS
jgi:hypothetical protein